ncbi:ComEC/Rec2 family competence protein [Nonomuraea sp. NPDC050783]|uniref:ComEC/Rec2 family competence protein n=1 Tax=Nonomuraea sp. NPDC050783 TaxID=3154634 RepID=UPI0034655919
MPKNPRKRTADDDGSDTKDLMSNKTPKLPVETALDKKNTQALQSRIKKANDDRAARDAEWAALHPAGGPPPPAGSRGDGTFRLTHLRMGAGDCTIMCTPEGRVVLVDCGTNDSEQAPADFAAMAADVLESKEYLLNYPRIDVVILTHPDKDHYNQLAQLLPQTAIPRTVYHSDERKEYAKGGWLNRVEGYDDLCRRVELSADQAEREISEKKGKSRVTKKVKTAIGYTRLAGGTIPSSGTPEEEKLDGDGGGLVVLYEKGACKITILAGMVQYDYEDDKDDGTNRASLVTLVEVYDKSFLLLGDATRSTERYLVNQRAAKIKNVDYTTAGHHGSNRTSTGQFFVDAVDPVRQATVSAGKKGLDAHRLPSWQVIDRYQIRLNASGRGKYPKHTVSAWPDAGDVVEKQVEEGVFTTGCSTKGVQIIVPPATPRPGL